ncbi:hypothetical protein TWF173_001511 [Orbilia oligospora]|uniref:Uncharacterized protein n=1 Tax=Orbilia oligospora TaxID=2813651 RepID=A0A7C8VBM8_ORBOL|nr:hypothetical protein TWF970_007000 [Orbilia oligospora]KAF3316851.1 hypothetical protein TWF173_001511 [Orbilia oligospora]
MENSTPRSPVKEKNPYEKEIRKHETRMLRYFRAKRIIKKAKTNSPMQVYDVEQSFPPVNISSNDKTKERTQRVTRMRKGKTKPQKPKVIKNNNEKYIIGIVTIRNPI